MKFTCNQQMLSKAVNTVSKAVSTRTTIPILKGILLTVKDNTLSLTASDMDLSIEKNIDVAVMEEGQTVVAAKLFGDIIRKLPNEEILIEEDENKNILIKTSSSEFKIMGLQTEEFPNVIDEQSITNDIYFNKDLFTDMVKKTSFSASTDESRGIIVGILIEMEENGLNMVSLDGFRMSIARKEIENSEKRNIIIDAKFLNEVNKIIMESDSDEDILLKLGNKKATIILDNTKVIVRLLEGDFINYKGLLPQDHTSEVIINARMLQESIERASLLAKEGKNNLVKLEIEDNIMTLSSKSEEGNVKEEIIIEKTGGDMEIGFNSKYLLDILKVVDDENIKIELNSNVSPCLIKPVSGNYFEYLVLPVRITTN